MGGPRFLEVCSSKTEGAGKLPCAPSLLRMLLITQELCVLSRIIISRCGVERKQPVVRREEEWCGCGCAYGRVIEGGGKTEGRGECGKLDHVW
jgi:hypothetical protein